MNTNKNPIVVVGTGRSGTSVVAGMLVHIGVYMGWEFVKADTNNPTGHFEDKEFTDLGREIASGFIDEATFKERARELFKNRIEVAEKHGIRWGWKIPITSNLVPLYEQVAKEFGVSIDYVVCHRPAEDVIASCKRCYGMPQEHAEQLCYSRLTSLTNAGLIELDADYNVVGSKASHVLSVAHTDIVNDPETVVDKLIEFAGTQPDKEERELAVDLVNFNEKDASVMVAIPNLGWVRSGLMTRFMHWFANVPLKECRLHAPSNLTPVSYARNRIVNEWLDNTDCDYLWMIDADTLPPPHALTSLLRAKRGVVTGVTYSQQQDYKTGEFDHVPMVFQKGEDAYGTYGNIPVYGRGVQRIQYSGASCLLLHRDAVKDLPRPLFSEKFDENGYKVLGEDFYFFKLLEEHGIPAYCQFECQCVHMKEVALPVSKKRSSV